MNTRPPAAPSVKAIRESLEALAERNRLWQRDEDEKQDGFRLHYAIDTDVISMYLQPDKIYAPARLFLSGKQERDEDAPGSGLDEVTAQWLGDFLLLNQTSDSAPAPCQAYILVPPHQEELMNILLAISGRAEYAARKLISRIMTVRNALQPVFARYKKDGDSKQFTDDLAKHVPDVVALVAIINDADTAIKRFRRLQPGKLTHLYNYRENEQAPYLMDVTEFELGTAVAGDKSRWFDLLMKQSSRRSRVRETERDAEVLAAMEYLNRRLYPKKQKLLLITDSPYLYAALKTGRPEKDDPWYVEGETLATAFLRHPQWIMSHRDFFSLRTSPDLPQPDELGTATEQLQLESGMESEQLQLDPGMSPDQPESDKLGAIPEQPDSSDTEQQRLELIVNSWLEILSAGRDAQDAGVNATKQDIGKLITLPQKWERVVRFVAAGKYGRDVDELRKSFLNESGEGTFLLRDLLQFEAWGQSRLEKLLKPRVTRMLSELYNDSTMLGLLEQKNSDMRPKRIMPALLFDSNYTQFNDYYIDVRDTLSAKRAGTQEDSVRKLQELQRKMNDPESDPSYYHRNVIHAAAYAAVELWDPALTLCSLALEIANHQMEIYGWHDSSNVVRGREAAYLAAIASRRRARNPEALEEAKMFLQEARDRENDGRQVDLRFLSEDLAIRTRTVYFGYFQKYPRSEEWLIKDIIGKIEDLIPRAETKFKETGQDARGAAERRVAEWVLIQCYTNLYTLILIRVDAYSEQLVSPAQKARIEEFDLMIRLTEVEDPYPRVVCDLMKIVAHTTSAETRGNLCAEVTDRIGAADDAIRHGTYMPYEKERRRVFLELVDRYR